jgi:hypothetical protein
MKDTCNDFIELKADSSVYDEESEILTRWNRYRSCQDATEFEMLAQRYLGEIHLHSTNMTPGSTLTL